MVNEILQGDIRDIAKTLPDESVHCIVTSPPYYGLRDYGTGEWTGGDGECDHVENYNLKQDASGGVGGGRLHGTRGTQPSSSSSIIGYKSTCQKCGATRTDNQIGLEETPEEYVAKLVEVFRELRRVLRDDGTAWLNLGDSFSDKQLMGIPWRIAFALQADGWYLRSDIIWHKPNPMPESVTDRPTRAHEYIFLLTKSKKYWYDQEAIREGIKRVWNEKNIGENNMSATGIGEGKILGRKTMPHNGLTRTEPNPSGRNKRSVWSIDSIATYNDFFAFTYARLAADYPELLEAILTEYGLDENEKKDVWTIATTPFSGAHFAVFPPKLIEPCILAGCPHKVCAACGTPYERVIEKTEHQNKREPAHVPNNNPTKTDSTDWQPTTHSTNQFERRCNCDALSRPGVVLDPFFGAGTVGVVATQLKRHWLGVELNPDYIKMAEDRINKTQPALFGIT